MKNSIACIALAVAAIVPVASHAEDAGLTTQFTSCIDKSNGVTQSMMECIGAETQRQDARLNNAYKVLMNELSSERKKQLQEAQRAWIKFRDSNCGFYFDPEGGTMARVSANECMMSMTANRAQELENLNQ